MGGLPYRRIKEDAIQYAGLVVFAFFRPKYPYIQLAHSISKFVHVTATNDINNKVIGFIGDRDEDLKSYAVVLQEQKTWEFVILNVVMDEAAMTAHYADNANSEKLCNTTGTKAKVKLTRTAVVPLALVHFLLEQLRLPNKLYEQLGGVVQSDTMGKHLMGCYPRSRSAPRNSITDSCPSSGFLFATNHANYLTSDTRQTYGQLCPKFLPPRTMFCSIQ